MKVVRNSSVEEYATWYLTRESMKPGGLPAPTNAVEAITKMSQGHKGKMRDWFNGRTRWSIVILDSEPELERLIFLESSWTKAERLVVPDGSFNYRLLGRVARNAAASNYLSSGNAASHRKYYHAFRNGSLDLRGESRIAICSAEQELKVNPNGSFYLLDGVGRCLPYMMLIQSGALTFTPLESFLAEKVA